jgi:predicted Rossmann fold nucleotide-binding protein DprA/Smf involved in DNA uptake
VWVDRGAEQKGLTLSAFIRLCLRKEVFRDRYEKNSAMDETLRDEIRQIRDAIKERDSLLEIDREMILNQLAQEAHPIERTLREKIIEHLQNRHLLLENLASYTHEDPEILLEALSVLRKNGIVAQDKFLRWYLL